MLADHRERPDGRAFADPGGGCDRTPADEFRAPAGAADRTEPGRGRNRDRDCWTPGWPASGPRNGSDTRIAAARVLHFGRVFRIGQERELGGAGLLHAGDAGDFDIRVAPKFAAQPSRKIAQKDALNGGHRMASLYRARMKSK